MTATDELRRLLDERRVEWWETTTFIGATITDEGIERHYLSSTWWVSPVFGKVEATDMGDGVLHMACLNGRDFTPEQAIAATLGSCNCSNDCTNSERTGTCTADETDTWECVCDQVGRYGKRVTVHMMECSECGHAYEHVNGDYEYCPHCGRRIEVNDG